MIETVKNFLDEYNLLSPGHTFLLGFSGGYDSLCLLDILNNLSKKYGFKLVALHLNHNWRGEESLLEEQNCRSFCGKLGIDYVTELAGDMPKTETCAREARYDFFIRNAKKYSNGCVFTAHNKTDNVETLIYRIIKGTGINGLRGIPSKRKADGFFVYRPLLSISRKEIENYCSSKGLVPNNDSSNNDIGYKRNFIRHKIIPLFEEINFKVESSISLLSKMAISQTNIVDEYISLILKDVYVDGKLLTPKFKKLSADVMKKIIYDACLMYNLDYDSKKIDNILEFLKDNFESKSGSRFSITNNLWVFANNKYIYVIDKLSTKDDCTIEINEAGDYKICDSGKVFSIRKVEGELNAPFPREDEKIAYVSIDSLSGLTLRTRREGDYISPFGMSGRMKLKKYLNSKGIFQHEKDSIIMLCKASEVLWVIGVGVSNNLKVVNKATHVLELINE